MKNTTCVQCQRQFEGRANRKYCSLSCKNEFHNERNKEKNSLLIKLNKQLHRNWSVLSKMYELYRSSPIKLEILEADGFTPKFHTHTFNAPDGGKYTMIYDFGFKHHFDNHVQIVKLYNTAVA